MAVGASPLLEWQGVPLKWRPEFTFFTYLFTSSGIFPSHSYQNFVSEVSFVILQYQKAHYAYCDWRRSFVYVTIVFSSEHCAHQVRSWSSLKWHFFKGFPTLNLDEIKHSSIPSVKPGSTQCVYPPAYNGRNITALSISWAIAKHLRNSQRHQTNSLFSSSAKMDSFQASGGLTWIGPNLYY